MSFVDDMTMYYTESRLLNRPWMISPIGSTDQRMTPTITLDLSKFTKTSHYPDSVMLPGLVLGKITATGQFGLYDPNASDGRQTAKGLLFSPSVVTEGATQVLGQILLSGYVQPASLPAGNGLDAAARTALRNIVFLDV
ncbi:head decoration protein [Nocardia sp. SYP-A9097]|uniref:head decoration protein n=1 Tax=Nocardia sp. SYP-A9097 TaxID=2663237 RepID=UPI0018915ED2|nr:head decoration protein [Nocardia sp. SYP-A9097]